MKRTTILTGILFCFCMSSCRHIDYSAYCSYKYHYNWSNQNIHDFKNCPQISPNYIYAQFSCQLINGKIIKIYNIHQIKQKYNKFFLNINIHKMQEYKEPLVNDSYEDCLIKESLKIVISGYYEIYDTKSSSSIAMNGIHDASLKIDNHGYWVGFRTDKLLTGIY